MYPAEFVGLQQVTFLLAQKVALGPNLCGPGWHQGTSLLSLLPSAHREVQFSSPFYPVPGPEGSRDFHLIEECGFALFYPPAQM